MCSTKIDLKYVSDRTDLMTIETLTYVASKLLPYATDSAMMVAAKMSFMMMLVVPTLGMDNGCRMIFLSSNLISECKYSIFGVKRS